MQKGEVHSYKGTHTLVRRPTPTRASTHIPKRYDLDFAVSLTGSKYLLLSNLTNNARVLAANAPIKGGKKTLGGFPYYSSTLNLSFINIFKRMGENKKPQSLSQLH